MTDTAISSAPDINSVQMVEQSSTPSTPASGYWQLYTKSDGLYAVNDAGVVFGPMLIHDIVTNSSGATAVAGEVGYLDEYGDYQTTIVQGNATVSWCVVVEGGSNGATIKVQTRGRATVKYTGSAPSDGDFLITSTVAGSALAQSYCSPAIFARCLAAGSGGTVAVVLLTQRTKLRVESAEDLCRISAGSGSNFTGTINGTPSGATLVYTITGGTNEDNITPASAGELAKIVLHNTTRGDSVLIDSVDTGTNTITATANIPGTWANTDVITTRSQTNTDTISSMYFTDYDLSSADNDKISRLAVFITGFFSMSDVGTAAAYYHPYETGAASKRYAISSIAGARLMAEIPIVDNKFCMSNNASGTGTCLWLIRAISCIVAAP